MVITLSEDDHDGVLACLLLVAFYARDEATAEMAARLCTLFEPLDYGEEHEKQEGQYLSSDGGSSSRDGGTDTGDSPSA